MVRWVVLAVMGMASVARAQQAPAAATIQFRGQDVIVGTTFGMLVSHDGGGEWKWFCTTAVGYNGIYIPDYRLTSTGVFATTFDGLKTMSDGCTFHATSLGMAFVSRLALRADGVLHAAASDPNDAKIYASTDGFTTAPTSANPGLNNDWWQSLIAAPSNAQRVYLSGYRFTTRCSAGSGNAGTACSSNAMCTNNGTCDPQKDFLLFVSSDGASTFSPLATTAFSTTQNSTLNIVAVDPTTADRVYAMVTMSGAGSDLYRSENAGGAWTKVLSLTDSTMSVVARANGQLVAASELAGVTKVSDDHGDTWMPVTACGLHISCLAENAAGELWACTHQFDVGDGRPSDGYGLVKTTDLSAWTGVLNFLDIAGPVLSCGPGTVEHDTCSGQWTTLHSTFQNYGVTPNTCVMTPAPVVPDGIPDGPPDGPAGTPDAATNPTTGNGGGCCSTSGGSSSIALGAGVLALLVRRRRRATSSRAA